MDCPYCKLLKDEATKLVGLRGPEPFIVHRSGDWVDIMRFQDGQRRLLNVETGEEKFEEADSIYFEDGIAIRKPKVETTNLLTNSPLPRSGPGMAGVTRHTHPK